MAAEAAAGFWSGAGGPIASAGLGLIGLPFQIAGQRRQQDIMRSGLEAQLRAQNSALETNTMLNRESMYGQLGESLGARVFGQTAADLEFGRQLEGEKARRRFADQDIGYNSEISRRERSAAISPERQQALRFENLLAMKREQARAEAPMAAMFGRKAPTNVSSMVV
jgi:hypothetical protein